ncbi:MAG: hypothetical protein V1897_17950 [Pseudomonadota bacterium]
MSIKLILNIDINPVTERHEHGHPPEDDHPASLSCDLKDLRNSHSPSAKKRNGGDYCSDCRKEPLLNPSVTADQQRFESKINELY